MGRPRLLFLSQCLPYPPHSGVTNRTYHIARELSSEFEVTLLAFSRRNHQPTAASRAAAAEALRALGVRVRRPVPLPSERGPAQRAMAHLRSVATGRPYTYYEYASGDFARELTAALAERPALVHMDSLDLYGWLDRLEGVPVACTHHSIESELLRLRAKRIGSRVLARYLQLQGDLLERIERRWCPTLALNVMMSDLDGERLRALAPGSRTLAVPNGVDTEVMQPLTDVTPVPGRVLFLGPTYMFPNLDAVEFFLRDVWPAVCAARPDATFHLVGRNSAADRARFSAHPGVTCNDYVPDVRPHLAAAECCIVPIRVGGGTRLKILDAWAMGRAVVSTTTGCEGLAARDGENILVRNDASAFAEGVLAALNRADLRQRLEAGARATAVATYEWRRVGATIRAAYRALLAATDQPAELAAAPRLSRDHAD